MKYCLRWVRPWLPALFILFIALVATLLPFVSFPGLSQPQEDRQRFPTSTVRSLPPLQPHPLPSSLLEWQGPKSTGDYFDQVEPLTIGYLVWSSFPVTVYVEPLAATEAASPSIARRSQEWVESVLQAVREWNQYLPLKVVSQPVGADIAVWRSAPPLRLEPSTAESGQGDRPSGLRLGRIRSAETRFELYAQPVAAGTLLAHRFTIQLRSDQAPLYLQAAARHELGHALGIWGHSPIEADALYFSQVRNPPAISARDIHTLKRIYEQPTRLGWTLPRNADSQ